MVGEVLGLVSDATKLEEIRPQSGYLVKRCPRQIHFMLKPPPGVERLPIAPAQDARMQQGNVFEDEVFAEILKRHGTSAETVVDLRDLDPMTAPGGSGVRRSVQEHVATTVEAMDDGCLLILGGRLPDDETERRAGKPDLLVRGKRRDDGLWGYLPVDVKHHRVTRDQPSGAGAGNAEGTLIGGDLGVLSAHPDALSAAHASWAATPNSDDHHQLAHYWRMLEACGREDAVPWGAIIGSERTVAWSRLDAPTWRSWRNFSGWWTTLERYDHEFAFRLDVIARAADFEPSDEPPWPPARIAKYCDRCEWHDHCAQQMVERDEVTLLGRVDWDRRVALHRANLTTRKALAQLDHRTAKLSDVSGVKATLATAAASPADASLASLFPRATKRVEALGELGIHSCGDLQRLHQPTLAALDKLLAARGFSKLADVVDEARVSLALAPHRRRDISAVRAPRADVEIDIDMESYEGGVYLWGAWVTDPIGITANLRHDALDFGAPQFLPFADLRPSFDPVDLFTRFWSWLSAVGSRVEADGQTLKIYCWSGPAAEERYLRSHADGTEDPALSEAVDRLIRNTSMWVDLRTEVTRQLVLPTDGKTSIKVIAERLAGFDGWAAVKAQYNLPNLGGDESQLLFERTVGLPSADGTTGAPDGDARAALLAYNQADVAAMQKVRDWMDRPEGFPAVEDLAVDYGAPS